jgi:adenylate cyclase
MPTAGAERRLVAVLAADVFGYSRLMHADDRATLEALTESRSLFAERVAAHGGRVVNAPGDSILAEFASVVDAVRCAAELQRALADRNAPLPEASRMQFRIGINVGDVLVDAAGSIYGDGVNVAARLEGLCDPGGVAVSASAYEQVRDKADFRFADRGAHAVKNIARPVHVYALEAPGAGKPGRSFFARRRKALAVAAAAVVLIAGIAAAPELSRRYFAPGDASAGGIAVLPFANQSGDAGREYFSDGVTEDIIGALGRFSGMRVIAHSAVQPYKATPPSAEQIARELGVRYVVQGSVREAGGRVRVGVELSEAASGKLLWSERYDAEGKEMFDIQDRIVRNIAGTLAVKLATLEQQRAAAKRPENMEAYDLVLRARELIARTDRAANRDARELLAQALRLEPRYAEAYAWLAEAELQRAAFGWIENPEEAVRRAEQQARAALAIDDPGANARAHAVLGGMHSFMRNFEAALAETARAIELNASDAFTHALRGNVLLWLGRLEESIAASETARRFDPRLETNLAFNLAMAYYLTGRYREALAVCDSHLGRYPQQAVTGVPAVRAAALAQIGDADGAREAAAQLRRLDPFFDVSLFATRFVDPALAAKAQEGLRKAGL